MRTMAAGYLVALLSSGATVVAQDAKTTADTAKTTADTADTKVTADAGKVVTMTGCVEIGGGTSFVLTNITSEHQSEHGQPERKQVPSGAPYALVGRKGLDLSPYILQKVELTGVVVPAATTRDTDDKIKIKETTTVAAKPDKTSSKATTVKVARGETPQFIVASVKTLAPGCQP